MFQKYFFMSYSFVLQVSSCPHPLSCGKAMVPIAAGSEPKKWHLVCCHCTISLHNRMHPTPEQQQRFPSAYDAQLINSENYIYIMQLSLESVKL
jgi:hypothetical protein